jgi:branched-chain amino acid aminotransferase
MGKKPVVWFNNDIVPWEEATIHLLSHGMSRGSGIFEVFGTHRNGNHTYAFRMDKHFERLQNTLRLLDMELKYSMDEIKEAVARVTRENNSGEGIVKIMGFWGETAIVNLVLDSKLDVAVFPIPVEGYMPNGRPDSITACFSKWRKLHPETVPVQAKACANYLNGYLIRKDAVKRGFDLGLNVGTDGFVAEGSVESVFIIKDGIVKTPPLGRILASVTRDSILRIAEKEAIPVQETHLEKEDIYTADEMFTCHTGIKIEPIRQFEDRQLPAPGPVTANLLELMDNVIHFKDERYSGWFQKLF